MTINQDTIRQSVAVFGEKAGILVSLTLKDADSFMTAMKSALDEGDAQAAGLAAHSLKSIMKQVGAMEVGDLAEDIQNAGKAENDLEKCKILYARISPLYDETKMFLENVAEAA